MNYQDFDIIVIGSGLASAAFAQNCVNKKILIIEGGDLDPSEKNNKLTINDEYGHYENHWTKHWVRCVGGTSRVWAGWLATLDERDFIGSDILPSWPIRYSDLHSFYIQAANFLGRNQSIILNNSEVVLNDSLIYKPFSNGDPKRLRVKSDICIRHNIELIHNLHLTTLLSKDRKNIDAIIVSHPNGKTEKIEILKHQKLVLACGGLGNAQVLLQPNSQSDISVGNESGLVGRYLMEHPHTVCGQAYVKEAFIKKLKSFLSESSFGTGTPALTVSNDVYYQKKLLACTVSLDVVSFEPSNFTQYWSNQLNSKLVKVNLYARSEQEPQANNRVSLTNEKNDVGLFKLRTESFFSSLDLSSIYQTTRYIADTFINQKVGVAKIDNDSIFRKTSGGGHTMGTTRMGDSPTNSVCDRNCKVHNYENLYLAGSSIFTTGGASNPTLSIVALAMRLAKHLSEKS